MEQYTTEELWQELDKRFHNDAIEQQKALDETMSEKMKLEDKLKRIKEILTESNVLPSTDCRLFLEDGVKIVKIIDEE